MHVTGADRLNLTGILAVAGRQRHTAGNDNARQVVHRGRPVPLPDGFAMILPSRLQPVFGSDLFSWRCNH